MMVHQEYVVIMVLRISGLLQGWRPFGEEEEGHIYGEDLYIFIVRENCLRVCFRSVHNVCIECLWGDVTGQVGSSWADAFTNLELFHGLDINNPHHIWLLHILFLSIINSQLELFARGWNSHGIQIQDGPNCSPEDMFGFDMMRFHQ